jgi:hypothetical protein
MPGSTRLRSDLSATDEVTALGVGVYLGNGDGSAGRHAEPHGALTITHDGIWRHLSDGSAVGSCSAQPGLGIGSGEVAPRRSSHSPTTINQTGTRMNPKNPSG